MGDLRFMNLSMPGGSGAMLRSRRSCANAKPNRVLDRNSSRGMIFENEELRLRTININEEIERGQNDIKKLRRENEQLRREIWALREECDRLTELLKKQIEEEDEEETEEEDEEEDEEEEAEVTVERKGKKRLEVDGLSVVPEEPEETASIIEQSVPKLRPTLKENHERGLEEYKGITPTPCLRINSVHPFTAAATVDPYLLRSLTVSEVIEEVVKKTEGVVGVRLLAGSLYISCDSKDVLDTLINSGVVLRRIRLDLHDVSQGTVVVAMSGVPHHLTDGDLAHVLSQFGPVIGGVERRLYRDVDTGERLARIKLQATLPKRLFLQGSEISLRPLAHEELSKMSMHQPTPPKLNIKIPPVPAPSDSAPNTSSTTLNGEATSTPEPLAFTQNPTNSSTGTLNMPNKSDERCHSAPLIGTQSNSPVSSMKKVSSDGEVKKGGRVRKISRRGPSPSSSSEQESPNKPRRRKSSVAPPQLEREKSPSLSSAMSFRRKLSATGRETGKLPWCACWGNGCI